MKQYHDLTSKEGKLKVGTLVNVKNFGTWPKWLPGVLVKSSRPVSFEVQLEDGRVMRRHVDHMYKRHTGEPCSIPSLQRSTTSALDVGNLKPPVESVVVQNPVTQDLPVLSQGIPLPNERVEGVSTRGALETPSKHIPPPPSPKVMIRYPTRERKPPEYLQDYNCA
jgi:hypothetical protein